MSRFAPGASGRDAVTVTVHDGRTSRDEALVDPATQLGAVLVRFQAATPFRVGDARPLPGERRDDGVVLRAERAQQGLHAGARHGDAAVRRAVVVDVQPDPAAPGVAERVRAVL